MVTPADTTKDPMDVLQARINVSVSQARRLVSSWLPPPTPAEILATKTEEQLAREDEELFRPMPPRLGLGAPVPKEFLEDPKAGKESSNEQLKRKLFGRKSIAGAVAARGSSKPMPRTEIVREESSDEEEGRSSLGKAKRRKVKEKNMQEDEEADETAAPKMASPRPSPEAESSKGAQFANYLDAHLVQKSRKKKKKSKK